MRSFSVGYSDRMVTVATSEYGLTKVEVDDSDGTAYANLDIPELLALRLAIDEILNEVGRNNLTSEKN